MKKLIFISLFVICTTTQAQVYSYVDQNGNTIYTDSVPEHQKDSARKLEIELTPSTPKPPVAANNTTTEINTNPEETIESAEDGVKTLKLSPPSLDTVNNSAIPSDISSSTPKTEESANDYSLQIVSPKKEETFINTDQITIKVASSPALASGLLYRYLIDDKVVSETANDTLNVGNLERGEHQLEVKIISNNNDVLSASAKTTFFIRQTTLADKRRINPCLIREYGIRPECPLKDKPKPEPRNLLLRITDAAGLTTPAAARQ